jgi:hypothetical protein
MSDGDTCIWQAWGEVKCKVSEKFNGLEEFYGYIDQDGYYTTDTDPRTDPNCAKYGCPEGRACASSGDCANGLSCRQNVCTKFSPFNSRNAKEIRDASVNDNYQQRSVDERKYYPPSPIEVPTFLASVCLACHDIDTVGSGGLHV